MWVLIKIISLQSSGRDTNNHLMGLLLFVQVVIILEKGLAVRGSRSDIQ